MWSLAIEEQFYVLFPLVVVAGAVVASRRHARRIRTVLGVTAALGAIASAAWMAVVAGSGPDGVTRAYFGTDTRVHGLLVGVVLGVVLVGRPPREGPVARMLAVAAVPAVVGFAVLLAVAGEGDAWMFRGGFLAAALAVAVVIAACEANGVLRRALGWQPLVALGAVSYGVYLWHWPVAVLVTEGRAGIGGPLLVVAQLALIAGLSVASYHLVERPIRHGQLGRHLGKVARVVAPVGIAAVAALLVATTVVPAGPGAAARSASAAAGTLPGITPLLPPTTSSRSAGTNSNDSDEGLAAPGPLSVVLVGDSVAHTLAGGTVGQFPEWQPWDEAQSPFDAQTVGLWSVARPGCSFLPGRIVKRADRGSAGADLSGFCGEWRAALDEALKVRQADVLVVALANDGRDRNLDGEFIEVGSPRWDALVADLLDELTGRARDTGASVVLVTPPPRTGQFTEPDDGDGWRERALGSVMRRFADGHDDVRVADLSGALCPAGDCGAGAGGFLPEWRYDGLHFTTQGAAWFASWLTPQLRNAT
jgi:lysophospholipase L1-like esterase